MADSTFADFGTVSAGTLRSPDLLEAFHAELEAHARAGNEWHELLDAARALLNLDRDWTDDESEHAAAVVSDLCDALNEYAPPYGYFGTHEGDGSHFGFWPHHDGIRDAIHDGEALKVADTSEVPDDYVGDVFHVNDHGNVTYYVAERGTLREVWGIV